jgi:acyl carrier protein
LDLDLDISRIVDRINKEFEIELSEKAVFKELTEETHHASVAELAKLVYDEHELG